MGKITRENLKPFLSPQLTEGGIKKLGPNVLKSLDTKIKRFASLRGKRPEMRGTPLERKWINNASVIRTLKSEIHHLQENAKHGKKINQSRLREINEICDLLLSTGGKKKDVSLIKHQIKSLYRITHPKQTIKELPESHAVKPKKAESPKKVAHKEKTSEKIALKKNVPDASLKQKKEPLSKEKVSEIATKRAAVHPAFICPITKQPMKHPVVASDGHSYEKAALENLLAQPKPLSPITNKSLKKDVMYENLLLKKLMSKTIDESELNCPITQEKLVNPGIGPDGHTYEFSAIREWLYPEDSYERGRTNRRLSPLTRQPMTHDQIIPNLNVKELL